MTKEEQIDLYEKALGGDNIAILSLYSNVMNMFRVFKFKKTVRAIYTQEDLNGLQRTLFFEKWKSYAPDSTMKFTSYMFCVISRGLYTEQNRLLRRQRWEDEYYKKYFTEVESPEDKVLFEIYKDQFLQSLKVKAPPAYAIAKLFMVDPKMPKELMMTILKLTKKQFNKNFNILRKEISTYNGLI